MSKKKVIPAEVSKKTPEQDLLAFTREAMTIYGKTVNLERAVPDFRDGLKPVSRRAIHAASALAKDSKIKAARLVGEVMGLYHPHGDSGIFGGISTLVDNLCFEIEGFGNWGNLIAPPAAMRYVECKLSKYGQSFSHRDFYNDTVTNFVPNYDFSSKEPLVMPAQFPNLLLNGSEGIGVGISLCIPAFTPQSLLPLLSDLCLNPGSVDKPRIVKDLEFSNAWGGAVIKNKANRLALSELLSSSETSIVWECAVEVDDTAKTITLRNFVKGINVEKLLLRLRDVKLNGVYVVQSVGDLTGQFGKIIYLKKSVSVSDLELIASKIRKLMTVRTRYAIYVTERMIDSKDPDKYSVNFYQMTLLQLMVKWLKWRIDLETRSLDYRIKVMLRNIEITKLLLFVTDHVDQIIKIVRTADDPKAKLMSVFKLKEEDAEIILERKIRNLSKLEKSKLEQQLSNQKKLLADLERRRKNPRKEVGNFLKNAVPLFEQFKNERSATQFRLKTTVSTDEK